MYKNRSQLAAKIDWEGGLVEMLLSYGLSEEDLPPNDQELREVFRRLKPVAEMFENLCDEFAYLLPDIDDEDFDPEDDEEDEWEDE